MSVRKKYTYLSVLPQNGSRSYYFLGITGEEIKAGDYVLAPFRGIDQVGLVTDVMVCDAKNVPFPLKSTKRITKKISDEELDSQFRMTNGIILSKDKKRVIGFEHFGGKFNGVLEIPSGVERIEDYVFDDVNISALFLPKELQYLGRGTIIGSESYDEYGYYDEYECDVKNISLIEVEAGNPVYSADENALYCAKKKKWELVYVFNQTLEKYVMPSDVVTIGEQAFWNCDRMTDLVLSENLRAFNENALPPDSKVQEIFLPQKVRSLKAKSLHGRFQQWTTVHYHIDEGNKYLFIDEDSIYKVRRDGTYQLVMNRYDGREGKALILENTSVIGGRAFAYHENLVSVEFPASLKVIEEEAFRFCKNIKKVLLPSGVSKIEPNAFDVGTRIKKVAKKSGEGR